MAMTSTDPVGQFLDELRSSQLPPPRVRRRIRKRAGLSLREIARPLDTTPETVRRWEKGATPRRERAIEYRRLLDALDEAAAG
jgi:DNA-binding transcriptional regulator YiaG